MFPKTTCFPVAFKAVAAICLVLSQSPWVGANDKNYDLIRAAQNGRLEEVQRFLNEGADVHAEWPDRFVPDIAGGTALMHASRNGHLYVVRLLLENGADPNANYFGATALKYAAMHGHPEVVKELLDKGADVNAGITDGRGSTALMEAAYRGYLDVVWILLDKGADVNARDGVRGTPLILASDGGYFDVVKLLVDRGADVDARDWRSDTAMAKAEAKGRTDMVGLLKAHGAKEYPLRALKGQVVASSPNKLCIRVAYPGPPELITVKLGLKTKFIHFRRPALGENVEVEYREENGIDFAYTVKVMKP